MNHAVGRWLKVGVLTFVTAALVACAGAAGKPGEPGADAQVPPLPVGTIVDQALEVAGTGTVALAGYFSEGEGETLTYTAASSAVAVATVTVSGSTLTIKAVAAGSAVITVTATDTDSLTAKQTFKVTVTAAADPTDDPTDETDDPTDETDDPTDDPTADPGTIPISDKMKKLVDLNDHLPAGAAAADYRLESRNEDVFTVAAKSTSGVVSTSVWEVTPVSKGTAKAEIVGDADGKVAVTLTVIVENRAPELSSKAVPPKLDMLSDPVPHARPPGNTVPVLLNENNDDNGLMLYFIELSAAGQFKDPDVADRAAGKLTYKITSSRDDVVIQDGGTCTTATTAMCKVWVDIVARRPMVNEFNLNVMAEDSDMATSPSVSFPIRMENPAKQTYTVEQFRETGDFRSIAVGYRATTEHKLVFEHPDVDAVPPVYGFLFAAEHVTDLEEIQAAAVVADGVTAATAPTTDPNAPMGYMPPIPAGGTVVPRISYGVSTPKTPLNGAGSNVGDVAELPVGNADIHVYTVKTTGRVSVIAKRADASVAPDTVLPIGADALVVAVADTQLAFTVTGVGPGTIEIGYHVWWDADGPDAGTADPKWYSMKRKLTVTVKAVD